MRLRGQSQQRLLAWRAQARQPKPARARWRKEVRKPGGTLPRARVAICRAISSLIGRGLLERTYHRGWWRLTILGKKVAPILCPELTRPAVRELLPKIKEAYVTRKNEGRLAPAEDRGFSAESRYTTAAPDCISLSSRLEAK